MQQLGGVLIQPGADEAPGKGVETIIIVQRREEDKQGCPPWSRKLAGQSIHRSRSDF